MKSGDTFDRGVSPVVGAILLMGLVFAAASIVALAGMGLLGSVQTDATTEQAATAASELAHDVNGAGSGVVSAPSGTQTSLNPEAGRMTVTVGGDPIVDESLGVLYYEVDDTTLAYQGGGVWRAEGDYSAVERPPPIQIGTTSEPTLSLPLITVDGDTDVSNGDEFTTRDRRTVYPATDDDNPLANETVVLTVESQFYRAWGEYFEDYLDTNATIDHAAQTATIELEGGELVDADAHLYDGEGLPGLVYNEGDDPDVANNVVMDSYDSRTGPYDPANPGHAGHLASDADQFQISNDVTVKGNVDAVGDAQISGDVEVYGDTRIHETGSYTGISGSSMRFRGDFSTNRSLTVTNGVRFDEDVIVGGDLTDFNGQLHGNLYVHGNAYDSSASGDIYGDVYVVGGESLSSAGSLTIHGDLNNSVTSADIPDSREPRLQVDDPNVDVSAKIDEIDNNNDNDNAGRNDISASGSLKNCDTTCTLHAGEYYLNDIDLNGYAGDEGLELNTTEGPITLAVDGTMNITNADLDVVYDEDEQYPVTVYVEGGFTQEAWSGERSVVGIEGDRAPLLQMYVTASGDWTIDGDSEFRGIVYGLSDGNQRTTVKLKGNNDAKFYGAVLGDIRKFDKGLQYHYDESFGVGQFAGGGAPSPPDERYVTEFDDADAGYLHVTVKTVELK